MHGNAKPRKLAVLFAAFAAFFFTFAFAARAEAKTVARFVDADGKAFRKVVVRDGARFPALTFDDDRAFVGWSRKKGTTKNPKWVEGQRIPKKNATYYPVVSGLRAEPGAGAIVEAKKHSYVYLVGDSRMTYTESQHGKGLKRTRFVAKFGEGIEWFENGGGYAKLLAKIKADGKTKKKKAVVFCLGVNDMENVGRYVSFYSSIAPTLKKLGCDLYVASVNPFSPAQRVACKEARSGRPFSEPRSYALKAAFDAAMRRLRGFRYVDTCSRMLATGFAYSKRHGVPDGLHYSKATNGRNLAYLLETVG